MFSLCVWACVSKTRTETFVTLENRSRREDQHVKNARTERMKVKQRNNQRMDTQMTREKLSKAFAIVWTKRKNQNNFSVWQRCHSSLIFIQFFFVDKKLHGIFGKTWNDGLAHTKPIHTKWQSHRMGDKKKNKKNTESLRRVFDFGGV